jgi:lysophospholipase L1-like esterase
MEKTLTAQTQESPAEQVSAWRRVLQFSVRLICLMVVLAFLAEGASRLRHWTRHGGFWGTDQTYMIDPKTNLRIPIPNGSFGPVHINSFGFRSPEIPLQKPDGRLRLAFLGGSTTYCAEVSSDQMTWPYLVVAEIKRRFPGLDVDFVNGGVPGYTTRSLKPYLEKRVEQFHPDVIVIYEAANDLSVNSAVLAREQGVMNRTDEQAMGWFSSRSLLLYLVEKNLTVLRQQFPLPGAGTQPKITIDQARLDAMYHHDLTALVEASKQVADLVVTVTFAPRLRVDQSPAQLRAAAITSLYYIPYMTPEAILEGFQHYNRIIGSVSTEEDTLLVEDEDSIPADAVHYKDSAHFTDAGSILMARRVSHALLNSPRFLVLVAEHTHTPTAAASARQSVRDSAGAR